MDPSSRSTGGVGPDAEQQRVRVRRSRQEPPRALVTRSRGGSRLRLLPTFQELELRLFLAREWSVDEGTWQQVDQSGKQGGISNKWTQLARENLGREFPDEFKSLHQELVQGTDVP